MTKKFFPHMRYVSRQVGKAIADYDMLHDGDKVVVAVSGGKDSLSLLHLLKYRQSFAPISYEILAVYIDSGMPGFRLKPLEKYFIKEKIPYLIKKIKKFNWETIDCFGCALQRRKALFVLAERKGFNKIALGHHLDDIAETILLNLFYRGEIGAMCPKQELFNGKITLIRPLAYVSKKQIHLFAKEAGMPRFDRRRCPRDRRSQRAFMGRLIKRMEKENPDVKKNILKSLKNIKKDYLL